MRRQLFIGAILGLTALPAMAAEEASFMVATGADLARLCGAQPGHPNYTPAIHMCHGYLVGVHQFHTALARTLEEPVYCIEKAVPEPTRDTAAAAYVAWIEGTPGAGEQAAIDALLGWANAAYPCN